MLKVDASELAVATVMSAMRACGLSGYREDGDFSIGRSLRDILSSPIMIHNDRIIANAATASLMAPFPADCEADAPLIPPHAPTGMTAPNRLPKSCKRVPQMT